jgi:hypothetical protein
MGKEKDTIRAAKSQIHEARNEEIHQSHLVDRHVRTHTPERDDSEDDKDN